MSEIVKLRTRAEVDDEAAHWIWRLDRENLTEAQQQAFDSWLRHDLRHRRAFDELSKAWRVMNYLAEAKPGEKLAAFADTSKRPINHRYRWLTAAATIIALLGGVLWMHQGSEVRTLATAVGQETNVTLEDGTIVSLNTNTILETRFSLRFRDIYLRKGEANFKVAHNSSRPFLVHAGDAVVRAVGTEFEVRLQDDRHIEVMVNEGRVEVQAPEPSAVQQSLQRSVPSVAAAVRAVQAGERLFTATGVVKPVSAQEVSSEMAWREGAINFEGVTLAYAIAEIQRYTDARIVVTDPQIGALRVGGRFRTNDVEGFFNALQTALPVSIRQPSGQIVYIDPRP